MKFCEATKEQKQYLVLGTIVGIALLIGLGQFVLVPLQMKWGQARLELDDLTAKLEKAGRLIESKKILDDNLKISRRDIHQVADYFIPDVENPLSWVTEVLYEHARDVGVNVRAVSERESPPSLQLFSDEKQVKFQAYTVRLNANCSYAKLKHLVASLQSGNPYLCVTGIEIEARLADPINHQVTLDVQWPMWVEPEVATQLVVEQGEDHG